MSETAVVPAHLDEWLVWIDGLLVGGCAGHTKKKWLAWCDDMHELHGAYTMTTSGWKSDEALELGEDIHGDGWRCCRDAVLCRG